MKVLLVNSSVHQDGCTVTALSEIAKVLEQNEIEAEIFNLSEDEYNKLKEDEYFVN